ncbi:hypothetical protein GQ43DRAFT_361355 [Delitschia confertaspora ATCC 74209]|uniref:TPR-like protein n=1 Tax=Delitschia confertaspora ATCC 74209 TaxID=1513339 RepID=A0A9P4JYI9_9PLEO|nr:hypothetical protein GQ43DRAFT_361355 [Delitschia confertaspora ATCC 74209]
MPPKRKDLLKPGGKSKAKVQEPETENDFLESADEFEQGAGKWRAGDAAKASRFFNRAIDVYNAGLQRYPNSFDLAYNKANLQYNMSEDPRIAALLGSRVALLEETLRSHRVALALNSENTDILFNTGQVLTSSAEALLEGNAPQGDSKTTARARLEEAVQMLTKCLGQQEREYDEMRVAMEQANAQQFLQDASTPEQAVAASVNQDSIETTSAMSDPPGEWATVIEPVTPETILETCIAQLSALTDLVGLYDPSDSEKLRPEVEHGLDIINNKVPVYIGILKATASQNQAPEEPVLGPTLSLNPSSSTAEPKISLQDEALLAAATFQANLLELSYRSSRIDARDYLTNIDSLFTPLTSNPSPSHTQSILNAQSAHADALVDFASALAGSPQYPSNLPDIDLQWTALSRAQTLLTHLSSQTSVLPSTRLADIFLARGDTDLFRFRLSLFSETEGAKAVWIKSKAVLVANAGVWYRGARSFAERAGNWEVRGNADARAIVAEVLKEVLEKGKEGVASKPHWKGKESEVVKALEQMVDEGIVGRQEAEGVVEYLG